SYSIVCVVFRILNARSLIVDNLLTSYKILKVRGSSLCSILEQNIRIGTIPIKIFRDIHCWYREGKWLTRGITFGHYLVISSVYYLHFLTKMFIPYHDQFM